MAQLIKEARRFQQLAGILKEEKETLLNQDQEATELSSQIIKKSEDKLVNLVNKISSNDTLINQLEDILGNTINLNEVENTELIKPGFFSKIKQKIVDEFKDSVKYSAAKEFDTASFPTIIAAMTGGGIIGNQLKDIIMNSLPSDIQQYTSPTVMISAIAGAIAALAINVYLRKNPGVNDPHFNPNDPNYDPNKFYYDIRK